MDPENLINLFDSYWFNHEILKEDPYNSWAQTHKSELKFSSLRSILVRSQSEDIGSSFNYGSFSPNSVLKSIPSSNNKPNFTTQKQEHEHVQEQEHEHERVQEHEHVQEQVQESEKTKKNKKRRHGVSKSLSDLEFQELKGFMDMGFVFSEQARDSSLVEIIPGLQRLGEESKRDDDDDEDKDEDDGHDERRPYLSEAWDDLDRKMNMNKKVVPVMKWEIPVVRDEIDMKDNLKLWAHTVASIVR